MKKIFLAIAAVLIGIFSFGQTGEPLRDKLDSIFNFVDKNQIPTGYLKEYGSEMTSLHLFNGLLTDSNNVESLDIFRYAYADLATSKVATSLPAMQLLSAFNTILDTARKQGNSTVAVLFGQYASLKPTALSENLLTVSNQQFYDVAGRSQSPYLENNLFAAAATEKYFTDTIRLNWSTALYYSNTSASLLSISIDFKDGNGYQLITTSGITKVYTDSTGSKPVVYKAVFSNGLTLYCHSSITVEVTTGFSGRYVDTDPYRVTLNINSLPGAAAYNDFQDKMQIRYSVNNPTRTNSDPALRKLRKPIIYVEGYDVRGKSGNYVFGQLRGTDLGYNLMDLIASNGSEFSKWGEWVKLANQPGTPYDFMHDLDDIAGYDLVFVNYNTMRSIPDNALMVQHVINWVNSQKASIGSIEKNVVVGISMGGLVARYCLANMTKNIGFNSTDTKILITHDSPHQGANVPLGFQYFLYNLAYTNVLGNYVKDKNEDIREFLSLNDKISTQQLLKARAIVTAGDNIEISMNSFLNGANNPYHQMVDLPESERPYKFVATSQGSQCGQNVFDGSNITIASQDELFTVLRIFPIWAGGRYWLNTNIKSLPATGVSTILDYKMEARFSFLGIGFGWKTVREAHPQNPANFVNWDGTPGGTQSISARTGGGLSSGLETVSPWYLSWLLSAKVGLSLNIAKDQFTFVHITSALDAPENTPLTTIFNYTTSGNANTRVDKFVSQEFYQNNYNIFHTDYTPRNARWMFNEMESNAQTYDCQDYCNTAYTISGPSNFCVSSVYSVEGLVPGSTITWSASAPSMVQFSCTTCAQTTITRLYSGVITLTATINYNCGGGTVTLTTTVTIGPPDQNSLYGIFSTEGYSNYLQDYNCLKTYTFPGMYSGEVSLTDPITNTFSWSFVSKYPSTATVSIGGSEDGRNMTVTVKPSDARVVYRLTRTNGCGVYSHDYTFTANGFCAIEDPGMLVQEENLRLAPNPSTGTFNALLQSTDKDKAIKMIVVRNKFGAEMKRIHFTGNAKSQNINIQNFPMDVYSVEVFDGIRWQVQKIIKQ